MQHEDSLDREKGGERYMHTLRNGRWQLSYWTGLMAIGFIGASSAGCVATTEPVKQGTSASSEGVLRTIGVVNPQVVLDRSYLGRVAIDQLKQFVEEKRKQLTAEEAEIRALDQRLKEQDKTVTDVQRQERQRQLAGRVQQYQQKAQQLNQEIATKQQTLTNESLQKIRSAIQTVAKDAGVAIVLHEGNEANLLVVLYHESRVDLTERVLQEVNRQNP